MLIQLYTYSIYQLEVFLRGSVPQLIKRDNPAFVFKDSFKFDTTGNELGNSKKHGQILFLQISIP